MQKDIRYDKATGDWAMLLDGRYVGSRATPAGARAELDRLAYDELTHSIDDERREFLRKLYTLRSHPLPMNGTVFHKFNEE